jgi:2-polyprenyl-3-methyl-5-hydroxy-6-metoxy-1,4-benzoquinol methylase
MFDHTGQPTCDVCGGARSRYLWALHFDAHPGPFVLWRCLDCGVVFNAPRLNPEAIRRQYDADYYIFSVPPARRWARATQLYCRLLLPLEAPSGRRRLLEIGCARGELLLLARRRGWEVQGIELSPEPARWARREYDIPVEVGTVEECGPALGAFDAAIAADVIEHVLSPADFLRSIHGTLAAGGRAIIETPNWGGSWRRLGGPRWLGLNRFHIHLFDAPALARLMRACGFRSTLAVSNTHVAHWSWGHRPEVQAAIQHLPAGLQWRTQRWLNRVSPLPHHAGVRLGEIDSPATALACIDRAARSRWRTAGLRGDNLAVIGRRS